MQADLTRYALGAQTGTSYEKLPVELSAALSGNGNNNLQLRDGDVLTIRQTPGWNDIAASATVRGEVQHPGSYGIRPGERLSSVLERAGGFTPQAYPYGAVLMRREVRDVEMKSHMALVQRIKSEQVNIKALPETDADQRNQKLTAIAQTETASINWSPPRRLAGSSCTSGLMSISGEIPRRMWRCAMAMCS